MRILSSSNGSASSRWFHGWCGLVLLFAFLLAAASSAQPVVQASPDKTIPLGSSGDWVADQEVGYVSPVTGEAWVDLGPLVDEVAVSGFTTEGTDALFVVDRPTALGGIVARPRDVVRYDGDVYSLAFDGGAAGLGDAASIDALSKDGRDYLFSFETGQTLPGGVQAKDHDVVRYSAAGFSIELAGSSAGIPDAWDVDAIDYVTAGRLHVSFDTSGEIGGVAFADEDLLTYDGAVWALEWRGTAEDPVWASADLDAVFVPEPSLAPSLMLGALALRRLGRRRERQVPGRSGRADHR